MRGKLAMLLAAVGTLLLGVGVGVGLLSGPVTGTGPPLWLGVPLGLLVLGLSLWKLLSTPSGDAVSASPWSEGGAIVADPPESTPETDPISGTELADVIETAAREARNADTVDAGLETVRAPLREALVDALQQGGWERDRVEAALSAGSWTDDPVAASVLDEDVLPPERSLRRRVWAWLFPAKAVRHRTARAVGAVATAAEAALPPVVGQHAPRPVPVVEPTLDDLRRASDGSLRRAVEGRASVGAAEYDKDDPDAESPVTEGAGAGRAADASAADRTADGSETADQPATSADWPTRNAGGDS